jgi:hypothetical protein
VFNDDNDKEKILNEINKIYLDYKNLLKIDD